MGIQPFTAKTLKLILIGVVTYFIGMNLSSIGNTFLDIILRSGIISLLYVGAIWYFKISEDLNELIIQGLAKVGIKVN